MLDGLCDFTVHPAGLDRAGPQDRALRAGGDVSCGVRAGTTTVVCVCVVCERGEEDCGGALWVF